MAKFLKLVFIHILTLSTCCFSQIDLENFPNPEVLNKFDIPDSLQSKSYKNLKKLFHKHTELPYKASIYAKSYIKKGLITNDSIRIARGCFLLSIVAHDSLKIPYLNYAIHMSRNYTSKHYPAIFYYYRGDFYTDHANYKEALDNYFKAYEIATENSNNILAYDAKFNIGALKNRIGKYEEGLEIFKEFNTYILSNESEYPKDYYSKLIGLFALSDSYTKLKKLDTATSINKQGIKISLSNNDNDMYLYFVMNEGANLYFKKEYKSSVDSLNKALPNIIRLNDKSNIMFSRFYLGKAYFEQGKINEATLQFRTVDSLFKDFKDLFPGIRQGYKILINHYKEKKDKETQLLYLNRLIKVDSILNSNYQYINSKIIKDFDTSNLILDKEKLISDLSQSNSYKTKSITSLLIVSIILLLFLTLNYIKRKKDKIKFERLISKNIKEEKNYNTTKNKQNAAHLAEDVINAIKLGLNQFEAKEEYLNHNITINIVAKKINSNSKYLSVFINHYEGKKFTDYINDLRIEYTIEKLKDDKKFRKYTIKAIAEAVGFSNPVSFSQAFYKKVGIKPSYFIKQLNKK